MNGSFFSQIYTNGAILSIFFYFSTPFLYACVFGMGLFFFCSVRLGRGDTKDFLSLSKKVLVTLIYVICSFFSAARRTNQEAPPQLSGFWLVATVAVGVCGTRSAQTVLALFPPSSLRLHRPIKAESGIVAFACILTPSPFGHSPYIPLRKHPVRLRGTAGERVGVAYFSSFLDTRGMRIDVYNCRTAATVSNIIQSGSSLNMKYEEATKKREENVSMW